MKIYFEQFKFIALLWRLGIDRGYDSIFIYGVKIVLFISKKKNYKFSRSINWNVRENLIRREQLYIQQKFSIIIP